MSDFTEIGRFVDPSPYAGRRLLHSTEGITIEGIGLVPPASLRSLFSQSALMWSSPQAQAWADQYLRSVDTTAASPSSVSTRSSRTRASSSRHTGKAKPAAIVAIVLVVVAVVATALFRPDRNVDADPSRPVISSSSDIEGEWWATDTDGEIVKVVFTSDTDTAGSITEGGDLFLAGADGYEIIENGTKLRVSTNAYQDVVVIERAAGGYVIGGYRLSRTRPSVDEAAETTEDPAAESKARFSNDVRAYNEAIDRLADLLNEVWSGGSQPTNEQIDEALAAADSVEQAYLSLSQAEFGEYDGRTWGINATNFRVAASEARDLMETARTDEVDGEWRSRVGELARGLDGREQTQYQVETEFILEGVDVTYPE